MKIHIAKGKGEGETTLGAFDTALHDAGVANYNLLRLSSVIPPKSNLVLHKKTIDKASLPGGWGDRLYVVMAEHRTNSAGEHSSAGIGWVQDPKTKKGLFVEHDGVDEATVRKQIELSLKTLMETRGVNFGEIHMMLNTVECKQKPVCALVIAVYQASDWENIAHLNA